MEKKTAEPDYVNIIIDYFNGGSADMVSLYDVAQFLRVYDNQQLSSYKWKLKDALAKAYWNTGNPHVSEIYKLIDSIT
jgi:hypothetical protein